MVTGAAASLIRSIDGGPAIPPGRKVSASRSGVGGAPTLLSNAETFAQLAIAARIGPERYGNTGLYDEPGTVMLTVSGAVARPMVIEVPTGVPLRYVLQLAGAPPSAHGAVKAVPGKEPHHVTCWKCDIDLRLLVLGDGPRLLRRLAHQARLQLVKTLFEADRVRLRVFQPSDALVQRRELLARAAAGFTRRGRVVNFPAAAEDGHKQVVPAVGNWQFAAAPAR